MSNYDEPYHLSSEDGWPTLSMGMCCDIGITDKYGYQVINVSRMRADLAQRVKLCVNACAHMSDDIMQGVASGKLTLIPCDTDDLPTMD